MAFKLTNSKEVAIRAFINEWLKDPNLYCNNCGSVYVKCPEGCVEEPCCNKMQLGTNLTLTHTLIQENKLIRESRRNIYASNKDRSMRWGISMIPRLLHDLEEYCIGTLKEPFLKDVNEMQAFMRSFPQFKTCEVV